MYRSFKVEIDPTPEQITKINKTLGVCRFVYNLFIAHNKERYENGEGFVNGNTFAVWLNNEFLPNNPEYSWIKEVSSKAVKRSIDDADAAFKHFFKGRCGYPQFKKKSRSDVKMYFYRGNSIGCKCQRHRIKIPTIGWIRLKEKGYIPTTDSGLYILSGRISKRAGRYYVSAMVDVPDKEPAVAETEGIGVHLGVKELAVLSSGESYENINKTAKIKKLEERLSRERRKLSRKLECKKHGGETQCKNIEKQRLKVQRLYQRISDIREDHINKTIAEIVKTKPSYIAIADIEVNRMVLDRYTAKAVRNQRLREFREKLTAKCHEYGIELRVAPKYFRSASICSSCGEAVKGVKLSDKMIRCKCGSVMKKALNASINLRNMTAYTVV